MSQGGFMSIADSQVLALATARTFTHENPEMTVDDLRTAVAIELCKYCIPPRRAWILGSSAVLRLAAEKVTAGESSFVVLE